MNHWKPEMWGAIWNMEVQDEYMCASTVYSFCSATMPAAVYLLAMTECWRFSTMLQACFLNEQCTGHSVFWSYVMLTSTLVSRC